MTRLTTSAAIALAALAAAAAPASAADHTIEIGPDTVEPVKITGATGSGANTSFFFVGTVPGAVGACAKEPTTMCETTLIHVTAPRVDVPGGPVYGKEKNLKIRLDGFGPASDFDLRVYDSNAEGVVGTNLGSPRGDIADDQTLGLDTLDPRHTGVGDFERKVVKPTKAGGQYYLVQVPYFLVANDKYDLTVSWTKDATI